MGGPVIPKAGHDIYIDRNGKIHSILANSGGPNKYYRWNPGTDANGRYATVTGELNSDEVDALLAMQASIVDRNDKTRGILSRATDPAEYVIQFGLLLTGVGDV